VTGDRALLDAALIGIGLAMAAGLALVVGHGAYLAARDRLLGPRLAAARAALAEAAATGRPPPGRRPRARAAAVRDAGRRVRRAPAQPGRRPQAGDHRRRARHRAGGAGGAALREPLLEAPRAGDPTAHARRRRRGRRPAASGAQAAGALRVAAGMGDPELAAAALGRVADADPRVRAGAARLLGGAGGEAAVEALERLIADCDAGVRAAAAGSLGRLHWPAGARPAAALRDPAWDVRRQAALALRAFGPFGEVLLRRALHDEDRFARDMAELALGLPEAAPTAWRPSWRRWARS
jgi:HEAT repeats